MHVNVKLYANLREKMSPKPEIGKPIKVDAVESETVGDLLTRLGVQVDMVKVIFLNGIHATLDCPIREDGSTVAAFPSAGGG